jgi:hypothetical protein
MEELAGVEPPRNFFPLGKMMRASSGNRWNTQDEASPRASLENACHQLGKEVALV